MTPASSTPPWRWATTVTRCGRCAGNWTPPAAARGCSTCTALPVISPRCCSSWPARTAGRVPVRPEASGQVPAAAFLSPFLPAPPRHMAMRVHRPAGKRTAAPLTQPAGLLHLATGGDNGLFDHPGIHRSQELPGNLAVRGDQIGHRQAARGGEVLRRVVGIDNGDRIGDRMLRKERLHLLKLDV